MFTVPSSVPHRQYCQAHHRAWWIPCNIYSQMDTEPTWPCTHHTVHFLHFSSMKSSCEVAPTALPQPHLHDPNDMTRHRVSLTASRSLLWRDDPAAWEDSSCTACPAQLLSLGAQVCADLRPLSLHPLSLLVQTGPTVTPKYHEHSALSEDTSSVKAGVLNTVSPASWEHWLSYYRPAEEN